MTWYGCYRLLARRTPSYRLAVIWSTQGKADTTLLEAPGTSAESQPHDGFARWMARVERHLADVAGLEGIERRQFCTRAGGPRFVARCALGVPGTPGRRTLPITVAGRTVAGWLTDVAAAFCP